MAVNDTDRLLSWEDVRYFLEVAEGGSLNAAAKSLGVSHTTVGRRIRALEERLRVDLFERDGTASLRVTDDGRLALQEARKMAESADAFVRSLRGATGRLEGEVRVNVTEGLASFWLIPKMAPFQEANPALRINWFVTNSAWGKLGEDVDVALRWHRPEEPYAVCRRLGGVRYSMFTTRAYVERRGMPRDLDDLEGHSFLHYNGYDANPDLARWAEIMRRVPPAMRLENTSATQAVLRSGGCIALLPDYAPLVEESLIRVPVDTGVELSIWLAYHEERRRNARVRAVAEEIARGFAEDRETWFA